MEPNFTRFPRREHVRRSDPAITIRDRGLAVVNAAAWEAIGEPTHVVLLFDKEQQILGFQGASEATPDSYPLAPLSKRDASTRQVSVRALFRHFGIPLGTTRRYRAHVLSHNVLAVDLREEPLAERSP